LVTIWSQIKFSKYLLPIKVFKIGAPGGLQSMSCTLSLCEQLKLSQNVPDILVKRTRSTRQGACPVLMLDYENFGYVELTDDI
jgi:hypothetical protein